MTVIGLLNVVKLRYQAYKNLKLIKSGYILYRLAFNSSSGLYARRLR
jgi:hypothetical protein